MIAKYHNDVIFAKFCNFFVYITSFTYFVCGAIWIIDIEFLKLSQVVSVIWAMFEETYDVKWRWRHNPAIYSIYIAKK